ncbi:MAG: hypothetical protein FKY71_15975 [Spiribacter salinus]|uniref:Uncharacterized protein n=1 Tax=Spiribacter salinus TaxID=1335746 RepID=A0A540VL88_9GAMM|nr:MAG: hypothetical protein FKY71_15975 [Spiribacter salinus]
MLEAKEKAHPIYREHQALSRKISSEGRVPTEEEAGRLRDLDDRQAEIYEPAWDAALARSTARLNSSSDTSSASSRYRESEATTGRPVDQLNALTPLDDQGSPSTSPKVSEGGRLGDASAMPERLSQEDEWSYCSDECGLLRIPRAQTP